MNSVHREQLITLSVFLVSAGLFYFFIVQPRTHKLHDSINRSTQLTQECRDMDKAYLRFPELNRKVAALQDRLGEARMQVPTNNHTAEYEESLRHLGQAYDLLNTMENSDYLKFLSLEEQDDLVSQSLQLRFNCNSKTFYEFLTELEAQETLTNVSNIDIRHSTQANRFDVKLVLNTFYGKL